MLTKKQHELLLFIDGHLRRTGFSPSFDEMKDALGLRSKSGIHRLISALEERGFLHRRHHRARALEILRLPDIEIPPPPPVKAPGPSRPEGADAAFLVPVVEVPFVGRVAAGNPIEAITTDTTRIAVPADMLGKASHYALEVMGDSMQDAGILDGDMVIIREGTQATDGQIVVALVDGDEVTLKRIRHEGGEIALIPANTRYETRLLPASRVSVQGTLAGLIRRY
ncbi:LexA repressor [Gluconacetobacter sp. SXCC-1]|uniref:LexA repressor n=1 Tax=Komagataeibacter rhaeticus TaxID=215221 RepID=A0A181CB18_9PROT|nr:transcriptional repressor LexA [Komagataeibacter rhaeticus]ATU72573.1 transcriptional repressor LexA [Komagataeibacter xylinus]EGG74563.1 LexA repressor [Gluconacetobacter sp. SXCC-1]QIP35512.1 transcriptional repressor LexA [Komagataeibacter rhaeticus]QOC45267.1 transcriptional repressor LexA [Komagataeibacter rhaeticus]WPP22327.1 transcriptional repressor LexA [Komagataeibacter rhaeticus]